MPLDDPVGDRQPETRTLAHLLGGEEGLEDVVEHFGRDPATTVLDLDLHAVAVEHASADGQHALLVHRVECIDEQVHQDVVQLAAQALDQRQAAVVPLQAHQAQPAAQQVERGIGRLVQVDLEQVRLVDARERAQVAHQRHGALDALDAALEERGDVRQDVVHVELRAQLLEPGQRRRIELRAVRAVRLEHARQRPGIGLQEVHVAQDEADGVVQLVRDAGDETADRRHLLAVDEL